MGFLSKFSGTKKLDLGEGFYVEVREYLTAGQKAAVEQALIQPKMSMQGKSATMDAAMDIGASQLEQAAQAVVSWNLTDEADVLLPFTPLEALRESLKRLPGGVVDQIANATDVVGVDSATFQEAGTAGA